MAQPSRKGRIGLGSAIAAIFALLAVMFAILMVLAAAYYIFFADLGAREIEVSGRTPLINSIINFYIINSDGTKGALAGSATSESDGVYFATVSAAPRDFLLAEASNGTYADGVNLTRHMGRSEVLTAAASAESDNILIAITPLTHMAATRARALAAGNTPLSTAVPSANIGVARQYGLADIIQVQPVPADDEGWLSTAGMDERSYSLVLAGISTEAETLDVSTAELADALADDASDGILDGEDNGEPIMMDTLSLGSARLGPRAGTAGVQGGIAAAPIAPNLKPNQASSSIPLQPVPLGINGAGKFYITSTMLPAAVEGTKYNFQLDAQGGAPPYNCALAANNADGTVSALPSWLQLGNGCGLSGDVPLLEGGTTMKLSQPFTVSMCDSANSCSNLELRLTTVGKWPEIIPLDAKCFVNERNSVQIATAQGGNPPYHYRSDYLRNGAPPMGMIVDLNGNLAGTPSVLGAYSVGVCVIDIIGAYSCGNANVKVVSRNATLHLTKTGSGTGKVYSNPYSKNNVYANGVTIALTATADSGSTFMGWGGDCGSAASDECTLLMDGDKNIEAQFDSSGQQQPSGEISVKIDSGRCGAANGEAYGPVGTELMVYYGSGHGTGYPVSSINCGKWTPGPDTQYQCQRGDNDPYGTGWAALTCSSCSYGGSISAVVYAPSSYVLTLGADNMMKEANANFPCK
jgi:hypothetical protein